MSWMMMESNMAKGYGRERDGRDADPPPERLLF
jgi:hypothetical protein